MVEISFNEAEIIFLGSLMNELKDDQSLNTEQQALAMDIWEKTRDEFQDVIENDA